MVIVSYNVKDLLSACLHSLNKYCGIEKEIWVADNNSSDGTVEEIRKNFPQVKLIANKVNLGFSGANNQCLEQVSGDYILLLNPDAELIDDSLDNMLAHLEKAGDELLFIGPRLLNGDRSLQVSCWKFPSAVQHILELFFLSALIDTTQYAKEELGQTKKVDFISGAAILFSRKTLQKIGLLDEHLFWMDDVDYCKRVKEEGGSVIYFPGTSIVHHIGQSSARNYNVVISNQLISKLKYYSKHRQYLNYAISVPVFFLQICSRIPLFFVIGLVKPVYLKKSRAYCYTFRRFFSYLFFNNQSVT